MRLPGIVVFGLTVAALPLAHGHVTVAPVAAVPGATQTYSFRVPSEGGRTTTGLVLTVPKDLTVLSVAVPKDGGGVAYVRKPAGELDEIVWTLEIKPAEVIQLSITVANGAEEGHIVWKITQKYSDGTSGNWTPVTNLEVVAGAPAPGIPVVPVAPPPKTGP